MIKLNVKDDRVELGVKDDQIRLGVRETMSPHSGGSSTVDIGIVEDGSPLSITNSGTRRNAVLDFVIPASIDHLSQIDTVILYCGSASEVT